MPLTIGSPEAIAADAEFTKTIDPLLKGFSMGSFNSFMKAANPYIGAATGAFEIGSDFINQLKVPTYRRKDYGQYNTLDALNNVAGNTKYLDLEERNFYGDSFGGLIKGAQAGMGFGLPGALIGGAVGMVTGTVGNIIGNNKRYNAEKERYEAAFKDINSQANYIKSQGYYNRMWNDFGYGGLIKNNLSNIPIDNKFETGGSLNDNKFLNKLRSEIYTRIKPTDYLKDQAYTAVLKGIPQKRVDDMKELETVYKKLNELENKKNRTAKEEEELNILVGTKERISGDYVTVQDEDAYRHYLGFDQIDDSIIDSKYKPTKGDPNINYKTLKLSDDQKQTIKDIARELERTGVKYPAVANMGSLTVLENATLDRGWDEQGEYISIYDKYDMAPNKKGIIAKGLRKAENIVANPYEIYDRIYLNNKPVPEDFKGYGHINMYSSKELYDIDPAYSGVDIKKLQNSLNYAGKNIKVDGAYGDETIKALDEYKKEYAKQLNSTKRSKNLRTNNFEIGGLIGNDFGYGGKVNKFWDGGELTNGGFFSNDVDIVEAGGTHEENKYGGVPISLDQQGVPNTVEEGEVIWNNYVFSNRIKASPESLEAGNLRQSYKLKTFADIAKSLQKESEERPFDFISNLGKEDGLTKLMIAQEIEKLKEQGEKEIGQMGINQFATGGDANSSQYTGISTFVKDNSSVDHMDSNKELLRLLHQYETSGTNNWDTNYNPQGVAFGRFQHTRTFLKDLGYLKSAKGDINDLDNWTDKEIGKKYIAGDISVQADISLKGAYRKEQSLIKNLGKKKYEDLKSQYGRENILAAAWHGGEQTVIDIVNGKDFNNRTAKSINEYTFNDTAARLKGAGAQGSSVNVTSEQSATNFSDVVETVHTPDITHTTEDPVKEDSVKDPATSKVQSMQELGTYVNNTLKGSNTDWMIHAPVLGNAAAYAESLFETPETVQYDRVSPQLLTERLEYSPINEDYIADRLRNQYEGSRRGITEVTGGNRGLAQYGMMQADKNMSESLYDAYVKGREINMARRNQVMDFNRQTSQYNSQADLQAQQINTQIDMQEQNANAANRAALRNYQSEARSRFLTDLSGLGKQLRSEALAPILFGYDAYGNYIGNKKDK